MQQGSRNRSDNSERSGGQTEGTNVFAIRGENNSARKESTGRFEIILFLPALSSLKFQKFLAFIQLISIIAIDMSTKYDTILHIMCRLFHFIL